jgi:hypothetical protein
MTDLTKSSDTHLVTEPDSNGFTRPRAETLKTACPLPVLLKRMHLEKLAVRNCCSPFRKDTKASWGIYPGDDDRYRWKDFSTGESGDEISFLAKYLGLDERADFPSILGIYSHFAAKSGPIAAEQATKLPRIKPDRSGFGPGNDDQLQALSQLRGIRKDALELAQQRGLLVFGHWTGQAVYGLTDQSGNVLEVRRLDGQLFPSFGLCGERKAHSVRGSNKSWPVGILEAEQYPFIALVEGIPDLLALFQVAITENAIDRVAPVAMLGGGTSIDPSVLARFKGKQVRIFAHADEAGVKCATKWKVQLTGVAATVDHIDFKLAAAVAPNIKDLCDFKDFHASSFSTNPEAWRLL